MLVINFTSEDNKPWDKLTVENFRTGEQFTTFRGYGPKKDAYYEKNIGKIFNIVLDGETIGLAKLLSKKYIWSDQLSLETIRKDTKQDYTFDKWNALMEKFYGNKKVFGYLLTFEIKEVYR